MPTNLVLVGLSGTGKSSAGRLVAERAGLVFVDTDVLVEAAAGRPIHGIFAADGEAAFRALEQEAVRGACRRRGAVIATGGGAVLDSANRADLWTGNLVVWLDARPEALVPRIAGQVAGGAVRPLLAGDPLARLQALREQRAPLYAQAHARLDTDGLTVEEVASRLLVLWRGTRGARGAGGAGELRELG